MNLDPTKIILGLLGPLITAASGLLSAAVGKYGVHLDASGINALGVAGATAGAAFVVKLIHDVETGVAKKNPKLVATVEALEHTATGTLTSIVKVDPQVEVAAKQAEQQVVAKVESADHAAAEDVEGLANAWPAEAPETKAA